MLPPGTLILTQVGNVIAQLPGSTGETVSLKPEQYSPQGSPGGRYGVRYQPNGKLTDLKLVDFSTATPDAGKDIPSGKGLNGPSVTWKADSSGFAFYEFPLDPSAKISGAISYYDVSSGQTKQLVAPPAQSNVASSVAFSRDGKYLAYAVGSATGEGTGGNSNRLSLLDTATNQSIALPPGATQFNQWLRDSKGVVVTQLDANGISRVAIYNIADPNNPKVVTPPATADYLVDVSPDGKYLVVSSAQIIANSQAPQPVNVVILNLDGSNRKALTKFTNPDQSITGLVWANNGIYYSISTGANSDTTWRMDLDGSNAAQVAKGTLNDIVGSH
jgi:Tol biopolymer transport system component